MKPQESRARETITEKMAGLSPEARARVLQRVIAKVPALAREHSDVAAEHALNSLRVIDDALDEWVQSPTFKVERNECSRLHKFHEAVIAGRVFGPPTVKPETVRTVAHSLCAVPPFVVQHDWAAAFKGAQDFKDGTYPLPYEETVFEFRLNGKVVLFGVEQHNGRHGGFVFVQCTDGAWWMAGSTAEGEDGGPLCAALWAHVRAICIALDAEIATHEIIRGPAKLNEARAKKGAPPLNDYHIVRLRGRQVGRPEHFGGSHRSPRLHFRRGHWRHLTTHTVWIRWCLAGDPDLGFIEKDYRL